MRRAEAILILACLLGCHHEAAESPDAGALSVVAARVTRGDVAQVLELRGPLEPPPGRDVKLGALVAGRLAELRVGEGDPVQAGQLLARVDPTPYRDARSQAEAALAQARSQATTAATRLERAERAFQAGAVAGQEVDDARAQSAAAQSALRTAEAMLSTASNQLSRAEIRAPFAGVVAHLFAAAGEPVDGSGKPLIEVADPSELEIRAPVAPAEASQVRVGSPAEIEVEALPGERFTGQVIAVAPAVDAASGAVPVRVRLANPGGRLKVGVVGRARVELALEHGVLRVQKAALVPLVQDRTLEPGEARALVLERIEKDGAVVRQQVETGLQGSELVELRSGAEEGELVVLEGGYALPDGAHVHVERIAGEDGGAAEDGGR